MINRRTANGALGLSVLLPGLAARSQQRSTRLGWLMSSSPRSAPFYVAFERRLQELGYVDGKNLIIDAAFAEGKLELLAPLSRELVARHPDVLFVSGPEAPLKALSEATDSIPIVVCAFDFDPVAKGYVRSLARPGGNITGVHVQQIEATSKRLELAPRPVALGTTHRGAVGCVHRRPARRRPKVSTAAESGTACA
jgi:putative ABC transport system substrate-binding protein